MNEVLEAAKNISGAASMPEMAALYLAIQDVPDGIAVDLGTHAGKFASVAAAALNGHRDFYCVDPLFDLTNKEIWKDTVQGSPDNIPWGISPDWNVRVLECVQKFAPNLTVHLVADTSVHFLKNHDNIAYCFVDSDDHQPELLLAEVNLLKSKVVPGGLVFFHDLDNQYFAPRMAYDLLKDQGWQPIEMDWDQAKWWQCHEPDNDSWHNRDNPCPCFVGGLRKG